MQVRLVVDADGGDPRVELVTVPAGEDLGELGDVGGERVQVGAAGPDVREVGLLIVVEVGRVGEDPAGQVAGPSAAPGTAGGAAGLWNGRT